MPEYHQFCSTCGIRQGGPQAGWLDWFEQKAPFAWLWDVGRRVFGTEDESQAMEHYNGGCDLARRWGTTAALPDFEAAAALDPKKPVFRQALVVAYSGMVHERLVSSLHSLNEPERARMVLSQVREWRESGGDRWQHVEMGIGFDRSFERLDECVRGALSALEEAPAPIRAHPYLLAIEGDILRHLADTLLIVAYGVSHVGSPKQLPSDIEGKPVQHRGILLGRCIRQEVPCLEFGDEILWLYEQAEDGYESTLQADPTSAATHLKLSGVQRQLGKARQADESVSKALAVLNRAIEADGTDEDSYSLRSEVFMEMGQVSLAIADLQRVLALSASHYRLKSARERIEQLRSGGPSS